MDFGVKLKLRAIETASKALGRVRKSMGPLRREVRRTQNRFKLFAESTKRAKAQLVKFGKGARSVGRSTAMGLTAPIIGVGGVIIKTAADFEAGMNRVQALTGASTEEFKKLQTQAKTLGKTTQFSATQAAEAMGFLSMAGFKSNEVLGSMPDTLNLAAAAQIDLGEAADIVSNILTGYRLKTTDLAHANDVLVKTFTSSNVNLEMLGASFRKVGPIAASMNIPIEETAALIGALGNAGIQAEEAGTGLRNMFLNLTKPANEAKKVLANLKIKKSDIVDSTGKVKSLIDVVGIFAKSGANASDIATVFGKRAGPQFAALLGQGAPAIRALAESLKLQNNTGTTAKIAAVQMKGAAGAMKALKSAAEGLAIAIGDSGLLQWFTKGALSVTEFLQGLIKTSPWILKVGVIAAGVLAVVGPLVFVFGALATGISALIPIAGALGIGFGSLIAIIGGIPLAIAGVVAAGVLLYKNWETVKEWSAYVWDSIVGDIFSLMNPIAWLIGIVDTVLESWDPLLGFWENIGDVIAGVFGKAKGVIGRILNYVPNLFKGDDKNKKSAIANASLGPVRDLNANAAALGPVKSESKVMVDFSNLPKGTVIRTEKDPGSNLDVTTGLQAAYGF